MNHHEKEIVINIIVSLSKRITMLLTNAHCGYGHCSSPIPSMSPRGLFSKTHLSEISVFQNKVCKVEGGLPTALRVRVCEQGRGRAGGQEGGMDGGREFWHGILFEEPNPTGSRPSDLIGLYRKWFFIEEENRTCGPKQTGKREETVTP